MPIEKSTSSNDFWWRTAPSIVKVYFHITKDEQLDRFKRREADPLKHWKITEEDWRNRRKWDEHNAAAEEMFEQTGTPFAGWTVVEANFKWYARLKFLKTAIRALESLGLKGGEWETGVAGVQ